MKYQALVQTGVQLLEALAEQLWEAQRAGKAPDENAYLERLRGLA